MRFNIICQLEKWIIHRLRCLRHAHGASACGVPHNPRFASVGESRDGADELPLPVGHWRGIDTGDRRRCLGTELAIQAVGVVRALGAAAGVAAGARATVGQARMPAVAGGAVGGEREDVEAKP